MPRLLDRWKTIPLAFKPTNRIPIDPRDRLYSLLSHRISHRIRAGPSRRHRYGKNLPEPISKSPDQPRCRPRTNADQPLPQRAAGSAESCRRDRRSRPRMLPGYRSGITDPGYNKACPLAAVSSKRGEAGDGRAYNRGIGHSNTANMQASGGK